MTGKVRVCVRIPEDMHRKLVEYARLLSELSGKRWTLSDVIRYAIAEGELLIESDIHDLVMRKRCREGGQEGMWRCKAILDALERLAGGE